MKEKKVRGLKRKTKNVISDIKEITSEFPQNIYDGYEHFHLPVSQSFINSSKTPTKIKKLVMQTLIERANYLINLKPNDGEKYRVVVAISKPFLWSSQIIIFKGETHYENFFKRNDEYQKWIEFSNEKSIVVENGLLNENNLKVKGFKEIITDEDFIYEGEIWFIGELD